MAYPPRKPFVDRRLMNNHGGIRSNNFIRAREVFVIDADGKPAGVMDTMKALDLAKRRGLDLVEVSPNANPPVCKVIDFGKYRYEQAKRQKDNKKGTQGSKLKELSLHMNIAPNDYDIKMRQAERFMWKGMKVKFTLQMRGRENLHRDLGEALMRKVVSDLSQISTADQEPKLLGKQIHLMLTPLPLQKRVRKYTVDDLEDIEDEEDDSEAIAAEEARSGS